MEQNYECPYHDENSTKKFLEKTKIKPCELPCPINSDQKCYRWAVCCIAKTFEKQ